MFQLLFRIVPGERKNRKYLSEQFTKSLWLVTCPKGYLQLVLLYYISSLKASEILSFLSSLAITRLYKSYTKQEYSPKVFCKKAVVKNFANFTGKHQCWGLFLIKLQVKVLTVPASSSRKSGLAIAFELITTNFNTLSAIMTWRWSTWWIFWLYKNAFKICKYIQNPASQVYINNPTSKYIFQDNKMKD